METYGPILLGNDKAAKLHLLQAWGIFANPKMCPQNHPMSKDRRPNMDGYRWRCFRCHPNRTLGLRQGTILQDLRVDSGRIMQAIYLWSLKTTGVEISRLTGLEEHIVGEIRFRLRVCCSNDLRRNPIRIGGGPGRPVQIDESMFNHKRRGGVGRRARRNIWVFGMADTRFQPARYHMEVVRNRSRRTLVPIINRRLVGQNLTVHSDMWQAYANLPLFVPRCAVHETVNHTQNFVDPITGAHIQGMESGWNRVKYGFKKAKGCRRNRLQSYLDEYMWIDWRGGNDVFRSALQIINHDYQH